MDMPKPNIKEIGVAQSGGKLDGIKVLKGGSTPTKDACNEMETMAKDVDDMMKSKKPMK